VGFLDKSISLPEYEEREGKTGLPPVGGMPASSAPPEKKSRKPLIILGVLVVILAVVVGLLFFRGSDSKSDSAKATTTAPKVAVPEPCLALPADTASLLAKQQLTRDPNTKKDVCRYVSADKATYVEVETPKLPTDPDKLYAQINLEYQVPFAPAITRSAACDSAQAAARKCVQVTEVPEIGDEARLVRIIRTPTGSSTAPDSYAIVFTKAGKIYRVDAGSTATGGNQELETEVAKAVVTKVS
jgi:hypothetical protein